MKSENRINCVISVVCVCLALFLGACSEDTPDFSGNESGEGALEGGESTDPSQIVETDPGSKPEGGENEIVDPPEEDGGENGGEVDCESAPFAFACTCTENLDCASGWCVEGQAGLVCSEPCIENCPDGWKCLPVQNLGEDLIYLCVPTLVDLCVACESDTECGAEKDFCVSFGPSSHCASSCETSADCPEGYQCEETTGLGGHTSNQCLPVSESCECNPDVNGMTIACKVTNDVGTCFGETTCMGAAGWSDCSANEAAPEICDGVDNDCNSLVDDGPAEGCVSYYADKDADGHGGDGDTICACGPTAGYPVDHGGDCNDEDDSIHPGAIEACNEVDDNCNDVVDEGVGGDDCTLFFADVDEDGYGNPDTVQCMCAADETYTVSMMGDCDDEDADVYPGAPEICDGVDQNCNDFTDEGCDKDGDGYCDENLTVTENAVCANGGGDCNDAHQGVNPGALEVCNEIDDDCDTIIDEDVQAPCGGCSALCVMGVGDDGDAWDENGTDSMVVNPDGYLELTSSSFSFNMMWVANSGENTVSRIDTMTGNEVGRYYTCSNPSRTAVDLDGNAWIGCRNDGHVAKILIDAEACPDKNGNGVVDTSMDSNGDGVISGGEMLPSGQDECVLFTTKPNNSNNNIRSVGVDADNNAWVGLWDTSQLMKLDGTNGNVIQTINIPANPYGLAIDAQGIIWVAGRGGSKLVRADPSNGSVETFTPPFDCFDPYGIALDQGGDVWIGNCCCGHYAWRYNPGTNTWTNAPTNARPRGIVAATDGFVYVANDQSNQVAKVDANTMTTVAYAELGEGRFPVGMTIDSEGFVWAVNQNGNSATKIDPATMDVVLEVPVGAGPYTYSDMTGFLLKTVTAPEGVYIHEFQGWEYGATQWMQITATTLKPEGTKVEIRYRTGATPAAVAAAAWSPVFGPFPPEEMPINLLSEANAVGHYIQVEVKLYSAAGGSTPVLKSLEVIAVQSQ